jgi:hypothetical protein
VLRVTSATTAGFSGDRLFSDSATPAAFLTQRCQVVGQFEKKVPDPSRKTWDGSVSTKPCTGRGCFRKGRPVFGRASMLPG